MSLKVEQIVDWIGVASRTLDMATRVVSAIVDAVRELPEINDAATRAKLDAAKTDLSQYEANAARLAEKLKAL